MTTLAALVPSLYNGSCHFAGLTIGCRLLSRRSVADTFSPFADVAHDVADIIDVLDGGKSPRQS